MYKNCLSTQWFPLLLQLLRSDLSIYSCKQQFCFVTWCTEVYTCENTRDLPRNSLMTRPLMNSDHNKIGLHKLSLKGRDRMIVGFITTYAISAYHHLRLEFQSRSMQHYVIKFVSGLRQVGGFLRVLWSPPLIKQILNKDYLLYLTVDRDGYGPICYWTEFAMVRVIQ